MFLKCFIQPQTSNPRSLNPEPSNPVLEIPCRGGGGGGRLLGLEGRVRERTRIMWYKPGMCRESAPQ